MDTTTEALDALLRYGEQLLKAGSAAYRTRQAMDELAGKMGIEALSLEIGFRSITATARQHGETVTLVREIVYPGVNSTRLRELHSIARNAPDGLLARDLHAGLKRIEEGVHRHSSAVTSLAVGLACGAFAFLNGGGLIEVFTASIAGAFGQALRARLMHRHLSPYATYAICGLVASAVYVSLANLLVVLGWDTVTRHAAGFTSSVLFLVPGFPMISAVLDLLRHETTVALSRLAYVLMLLLMAALGLSLVIEAAGIVIDAPVPPDMDVLPLTAARLLASFVGAFGFAILFNGSFQNAVIVGLLAIFGNGLRLALARDYGLSLPLATFLGALVIGFFASYIRRYVNEPRFALTVAASVMMVPGVYTFEMLVYFNKGDILAGLEAGFLAAFVVGAMALGLAVSRFLSERAPTGRPST
ncbi:MAG TPA: threonine/serine exporter family protein [Noviherbaspirillum sp.]